MLLFFLIGFYSSSNVLLVYLLHVDVVIFISISTRCLFVRCHLLLLLLSLSLSLSFSFFFGGQAAEAGDEEEPRAMDDILREALLLALKTTVKADMLPLLASTLYAQHVRPAAQLLRNTRELNVKQTQWKKFGTFLQVRCVSNERKKEGEKQKETR